MLEPCLKFYRTFRLVDKAVSYPRFTKTLVIKVFFIFEIIKGDGGFRFRKTFPRKFDFELAPALFGTGEICHCGFFRKPNPGRMEKILKFIGRKNYFGKKKPFGREWQIYIPDKKRRAVFRRYLEYTRRGPFCFSERKLLFSAC